MVGQKVVTASLHTIESDGEVNSVRGPIEVYGEGTNHTIEQALFDFVHHEPSYPKELRLQLQNGTEVYIRHDYHGNAGVGGSNIEIVL